MKLNNLLKGIGIVLFIIILTRLDYGRLRENFSSLNLSLFIAALLTTFPIVFFQSLRWRTMLRVAHLSIPIMKCFAIYVASSFIGSLTPGKLGEFSRIMYLTPYNVPFERSFTTVVFDRLADVIFTLLLGLLSLIYLMNLQRTRIIEMLLLMSALFTLIFILRKRIAIFLRAAITRATPATFRGSVSGIFDFVPSFLSGIRLRDIFSLTVITSAAWVVFFVRMILLARSINLDIPVLYICLCAIAAALLVLIPVTIQGVGTRDIAFIGVFSLAGVSKEAAVSYSLCILLANLIFQSLCSAAFLFVPMNFSKLKNYDSTKILTRQGKP